MDNLGHLLLSLLILRSGTFHSQTPSASQSYIKFWDQQRKVVWRRCLMPQPVEIFMGFGPTCKRCRRRWF
jgi:hypothetical protein